MGTSAQAGRTKLPKLQLCANVVARSQTKYQEALKVLNDYIKASYPSKQKCEIDHICNSFLDEGDNLLLTYEIENSLLNIKKKSDKNKYTPQHGQDYLELANNALKKLITKTNIINKSSVMSQEAKQAFSAEYFDSMGFDELTRAIFEDLTTLPEDMQNGWLNSFYIQLGIRIELLVELYNINPNEPPSLDFLIDTRKQIKAIESFYMQSKNCMTPFEEENKPATAGRPQKPQSFIVCRYQADAQRAYNEYKKAAIDVNANILTPKQVLEKNKDVITNATGRIALKPIEKTMSDRYKANNLIEDLTQQLKNEQNMPRPKPRAGRTPVPLPDRIKKLKKEVKQLSRFIEEELQKAENEGAESYTKTMLLLKKAERRDLRYGLKRQGVSPNTSIEYAITSNESKITIKMRQELKEVDNQIDDLTKALNDIIK